MVSHAKLDPDRRTDPGTGFPWEQFRQLVLSGGDDNVPDLAALAPDAGMLESMGNTGGCCMG